MDMKSIDDHTEVLTYMVCKYLWYYMTENPSCTYTDAMQGLSNAMFGLAQGIDERFEDLEKVCGSVEFDKVLVPEFAGFLEFDSEEYPDQPWNEDEDDDDD